MREIVGEKNIAKGQYWSKTLTLVKGCTPISEGCAHCWSAAMASRFSWGKGFAEKGKWTGKVELNWTAIDWLEQRARPTRRLKPQVFCIWNDLFHSEILRQYTSQLRNVIDHMIACRRHGDIFLILTKRPEQIAGSPVIHEFREIEDTAHIWLGVTVENQNHIHRIDALCQAWPGHKFVSIEPCLGAVDLFSSSAFEQDGIGGETGYGYNEVGRTIETFWRSAIDWIILGAERGLHARPMHPDWARSVRDQCVEAGVPFFFKHWGEWVPVMPIYDDNDEHLERYMEADERRCKQIECSGVEADPYYQPPDGTWIVERVGKKNAGRLLDGKKWNEIPGVNDDIDQAIGDAHKLNREIDRAGELSPDALDEEIRAVCCVGFDDGQVVDGPPRLRWAYMRYPGEGNPQPPGLVVVMRQIDTDGFPGKREMNAEYRCYLKEQSLAYVLEEYGKAKKDPKTGKMKKKTRWVVKKVIGLQEEK